MINPGSVYHQTNTVIMPSRYQKGVIYLIFKVSDEGYKRQVLLSGDGKMNIDLQGQVMMLKNVIVSAEKLSNIRGVTMGVQNGYQNT